MFATVVNAARQRTIYSQKVVWKYSRSHLSKPSINDIHTYLLCIKWKIPCFVYKQYCLNNFSYLNTFWSQISDFLLQLHAWDLNQNCEDFRLFTTIPFMLAYCFCCVASLCSASQWLYITTVSVQKVFGPNPNRSQQRFLWV